MIPASHSRLARLMYNPWMDRLLPRNFSNFYLAAPLPELDPRKGVLVAPNHMSWWDGFFIDYFLRKETNRTFYVMMLERQLRRYWFFSKLGAFSIDQDNPPAVEESLNYTASLLMDPSSAVIMFPQGILEPYDKRPFALRRGGILALAMKSEEPFVILPLGLKICYYEERKPSVILMPGEPIPSVSIQNDFPLFESGFTRTIESLDRASFDRNFANDLFHR